LFWWLYYSTYGNNNKKITASFIAQGVKVEILKEGSGEGAKNGDLLTVNYTAYLPGGEKINSIYDGQNPFIFQLGTNRLIRGLDLGLLGIKVNEKRKITIPSELTFGIESFSRAIMPTNTALIFEVELLKIGF
jgi:FKBP-type peptidyl-prolyl cis-trans isomerase